jgi:hypothetical protein
LFCRIGKWVGFKNKAIFAQRSFLNVISPIPIATKRKAELMMEPEEKTPLSWNRDATLFVALS